MPESQLESARRRGANIEQLADLVEVRGFQSLIDQLKSMAAANAGIRSANYELLIKAIGELVATVEQKEIETSIDLDPLISAIRDLRIEVINNSTPCDYRVEFEREPNTRLMKSGIRFIAEPSGIQS